MKRFLRRFGVVVLGLVVCLLVLRAVLFHGPQWTPTEIADDFFVDLHCHTAGIGAGDSGCFVSDDLRDSYKFGIYLKAFGVREEELQEHGDGLVVARLAQQVQDSIHIDAAVVLAMDGVIDSSGKLDRAKTQIYVPNEFVAAEVKKYDELLFGASINPMRPDALDRLQRCVDDGAVLVKWIPSIQEIDPGDPALTPFYEALVQHDLPLLCHTGNERSFVSARDELADPMRLELPLKIGVTVIAAHAATTGKNDSEPNEERLLPLMRFPNLYTEISSLTQVNKLGTLDRAVGREEYRGRLLYGSDYPLINTRLVSAWFFPLHLTFAEMHELESIKNPFDRDVQLKQKLGIQPDLFTRTAQVLKLSR